MGVPGVQTPYLLSAMSQSSSSSFLVRLERMMEKTSGGSFARTTRMLSEAELISYPK
jgi:hypothetical protein